MAVRLQDIADEMGVSKMTVSKVLRGSKDVGEKTRQRILNRLRELNYQPNFIARALTSGRSQSVGLIVPDLVHPFFAEVAKSLSATLREHHQALILASSEEQPALEEQEIRTLLARGVDALILASCQSMFKSMNGSEPKTTPLLLIDRNFPRLHLPFVGSDDLRAGEIATQHLIDRGRRRIAHIGTKKISTGRGRMRGYLKALEKNNLPVLKQFVLMREGFDERGEAAGYQAIHKLLSSRSRPDAVFCYNDLTAIGGMQAALEAGVRVPDDIAFVGCGNFKYAEYLAAPLSSIDHCTEEIGRLAGELALRLIGHPDGQAESIIVEPRLVIRKSS